MSLACQSCGAEFEPEDVDDAEEARKAGLTPMFVEYTEVEHEVFGTGGKASYLCSPECMAGYLDEHHVGALDDLGLLPDRWEVSFNDSFEEGSDG